jgi:lipooligosaccharide transport system permease protein
MTALAKSFDFFVYYFTLVITPMMFLSGVFFPSDAMPPAVQRLAELLPLTHGTSLSRALTLGMPIAHPWLDVGTLALYALGFIVAAVLLLQRRLMK